MSKTFYNTTLVLMSAMLLLHCTSADTLGDTAPVEVNAGSPPTFANGVGALLDLKCGYCHAYPLPDLAPNNIVTDLDLTVYETRIQDGKVIRGADSIGRWIADGILDHPVEKYVDIFSDSFECGCPRQMPLDYGTPLTDSEKAMLHDWSNSGSPKDGTPEPALGDAANGSILYFSCDFCHGGDAQGLVYQGDKWFGPDIRPESLTTAKIKSMWLWSQPTNPNLEPLTTQEASDLRAHVLNVLGQ